ncbi:uncharacterized protein C8Q71DRAFT_187015 [Rhodofomes roseus]|uniref:BTB domain-containing protein n=1 Tax=Rhodofomes roseus TaxID=34475 RepID=A0ABQ8K8V7_9APHY|nr:uncharacterized protein C8Q71DRAFT_187015 [Rhodofomes roseus]KAH9833505.1 hypothetical protein C8Q71DRAFT_187015 [Rhodofomes roseus]
MAPTRHERFYFDDGNVVFLVEETLFNVHRYFLKRESPFFQEMFSMKSDEGRTDDNPILLEGTKSQEFACLLACLYPRTVGKVDEMLATEWALVLDFAIKWQFNDIRDLAVEQLKYVHTYSPTLALQIASARKHGMDGWYFHAVVKMCERGRAITPAEAEQLGLTETVRISAIRHKLHSGGGRPSLYAPSQSISVDSDQKHDIASELGLSRTLASPVPIGLACNLVFSITPPPPSIYD